MAVEVDLLSGGGEKLPVAACKGGREAVLLEPPQVRRGAGRTHCTGLLIGAAFNPFIFAEVKVHKMDIFTIQS
ncbi:hypothetical protein Y1Q_0009779 [Alligator mississippiensis]|uniref:Uncharacterized protein n=1 Tax=Alligator mississippiensis TaxID=8496 RepID=A0A151MWR0_ALLMI|nr:hypothetical protein Y1Q_0009779 [Alligator mississippiensis]